MEIQSFNSATLSSVSSVAASRANAIQAAPAETQAVAEPQGDQVSIAGAGEQNAEPKADNVRHLRLVHINDVHGAVEADNGKGGLRKAATVLKQEKAIAPDETLTLNAGDLAEGSMVAYLTKGAVVTKAMANIGFDAVEPGNHDFAWGQDALHQMLDDINAPVLNASITDDAGNTFGAPYMMKEVNGVKVGMIGVDVQNMARYVSDDKLEGLNFASASDTIAKYLPVVKEQGADLIMLVSHVGFEDDKKLAQMFPDIDVIVGGHSHTELPEGHYEGKTLIVQSGTKGQFVGSVDLDVDLSTRSIVNAQARLIPVDESVEPDPEVSAIIDKYEAEAAEIGSRHVGTASEDMHFSHKGLGKLNQIHADSVFEASKGAGAEICLVSARNLRGNVPAGEVTYEQLFSAFPHTEEDAVVMKAKGSDLIAEMEERIADGGRGPATPAGFTYSYDPSLPSGSRITDITMADGSKFDPDREYTVATTISMARKDAFKSSPRTKIGSSQEIFMQYFTNNGPWNDAVDSRIQVKQ